MIRQVARRIPAKSFRPLKKLIRVVLGALHAVGLVPAAAHALEVEPVSQQDFTAENPLTIQNRSTVAQTQVPSSTTTIKTSRTVKDPIDRSQTGVWDMFYLMYDDIGYNRSYTYYAMATDRCSTATTIEFTDLTNIGDTGSVTVMYPLVGEYQGAKLGATVTYTVTYDPNQWDSPVGTIETTKIGYPFLQISDSLYNGVRQMNSREVQVHVEFFDSETGGAVEVKNSWFSVSSLNPYSAVSKYDSYITGSEQTRVKQADTQRIEYRSDGIVEVHQSQDYAIAYSNVDNPAAATWVDELGRDTFAKATAVIYQENFFNFTIRGHGLSKPGGGAKYAVWWALSSSSLGNQMPDKPTKAVDKTEAEPDEVLTYRVSQTVNDLGVNSLNRYSSMSMVDALPTETDFIDNSAKLYKIKNNGTTTEVTHEAGSFEYEPDSRKLTYAFSSSYLANMEMKGETYAMEFQVKLNASAASIVTNTAHSLINGYEFASNEVETRITRPELSIDKTAAARAAQPGDRVTYEISVAQLREMSTAKNIVIEDAFECEGVLYLADTIKVYDQTGSDITKSCSIDIGAGLRIESNRDLAYLDTLRLSYEVIIESIKSPEIVNTASAYADNAAQVTDSESLTPTEPVGFVDVIKSADPESKTPVTRGQEITYVLTITNSSGVNVEDIAVHDSIPAQTTFAGLEEVHGASYHESLRSIGWNIDHLEAGGTTKLTFTVKVNEDVEDGSMIENFATYAWNTPQIPEEPLESTTNSVEHSVKNPAAPSGYDKTGTPFGSGWVLFACLGLLCASGLGYAFYQKRRIRNEKRRLFARWNL